MSGLDPLAEFLAAEAARPGVEGDCGRFLARWVATRAATPIDASGPQFGGKPSNLYRIVARCCKSLRLAETNYPKRGDVAVVRVGNATMAAICTGRGWVAKTERGVLIVNDGDAIRSWKVA